MKIRKTSKNGNSVLRLSGDLNFASYKALRQVVEDLFEQKQKKIIVDLGDVTHIDSMGLGTITQLWKEGYERGQEICLAAPNPNVANMIRLVNLDKRIKVYESVGDSSEKVGDASE
ncbi:MAG: STAS domain-containing protein [bacterium]